VVDGVQSAVGCGLWSRKFAALGGDCRQVVRGC
jgi:hypothetical protein